MNTCPVCGEMMSRVSWGPPVCDNPECMAHDTLIKGFPCTLIAVPVEHTPTLWTGNIGMVGAPIHMLKMQLRSEETPDETNADSGRRTD